VRHEPAPVSGDRPRLVVLVVIDGLPQRQVVDYWDQLAPDGFMRFLDRGAWFTDAHYGYSHTVTCAGHATILTGAYPHRSGIIGNETYDPATGELDYCAADSSATNIGVKTGKLDGTSPRKLLAESLGDVLKRMDARSKVIAVSAKDRGAILPAGKAGTAYMYREDGTIGSTTYYMAEHPAWVTAFNAAKPADAYFHKEWKPLLPEPAYARSLADSQSWYAPGGKLPKKLGAASSSPDTAFYRDVVASPFGDDLLLAFARAAIAGEALGKDDAPDILSISLSTHDYINHAYGAESRISQDHFLYLDRMLQDFFNDLDQAIGRDHYLLVLTADHGFAPAPEHSRQLGRDAGRVPSGDIVKAMEEGLDKRFGPGPWVKVMADTVVLNRKTLAERKVEAAVVAEETQKILRAQPGIGAVYTRAELVSGNPKGAPFLEAMRKSWHPDRSGDLQFVVKPWWLVSGRAQGTTHGSPHAYDTHVPILLYGPSWVRPGRIDRKAEVADIAPTLSRLLRVPPPSASEGRLLPIESP
jgi:predicted AlkP superfamily pyrophosphatase or phosphodiesterase